MLRTLRRLAQRLQVLISRWESAAEKQVIAMKWLRLCLQFRRLGRLQLEKRVLTALSSLQGQGLSLITFCSRGGALLPVWLMVGTQQVSEWSIECKAESQGTPGKRCGLLPMFSRQQLRGVGQSDGGEKLWEVKTGQTWR